MFSPATRSRALCTSCYEDGVVADYELRDLVVTRPAVPQMVLDVSKGKVSFAKQPKLLEIGQIRARLLDDDPGRKAAQAFGPAGMSLYLRLFIRDAHFPIFARLMDRKFGELAERIAAHSRSRTANSPDFSLL